MQSLACQSRCPHHHPNEHTPEELKLIRDMRRRNPELGLSELWYRLRKRGYTRRPESLFRVLRRLGLSSAEPKKEPYKPKPYEQMTYPGQRVQIDVKVVPRACITDPELRLFPLMSFPACASSGPMRSSQHTPLPTSWNAWSNGSNAGESL